MSEVARVLQALSGVLWLPVVVLLAPSVWRIWTGGANRAAILAAPSFYVGVLQILFVVRWRIWPHSLANMATDELAFWAGLYALSCACALATLYRAWLTRAER